MRVCNCPLSCFSDSSLAHHSPCPLKLEDVKNVSCSPSPVSIVLEKKLSDENVVEVGKNRLDDGKVEVVLKSSLKKPDGCGAKGVKKGRVKWMDFLGKELVEIREFEPLESRADDEGVNSPTCMCVIQ